MTISREECAKACETAGSAIEHIDWLTSPSEGVRQAAVYLRQTCGTCRHYVDSSYNQAQFGWCRRSQYAVPADGSGYCHHYDPATPKDTETETR